MLSWVLAWTIGLIISGTRFQQAQFFSRIFLLEDMFCANNLNVMNFICD